MRRRRTCKQGLLVVFLSAGFCACTVAGSDAPRLTPVDASQFIAPAGVSVDLQFVMNLGQCNPAVEYVVQSYSGAQESRGSASCESQGDVLKLPLRFHRGYHEILFPALGACFGVVAVDNLGEGLSDFFGVDTAFSFLERSPVYREQFIGQLSRLGINQVRDRINWNELHPEREDWNGGAGHGFDDLRQKYAKASIKVLDVLQDLPENSKGYFPASEALSVTASRIPGRWANIWSGVEVSNEPDHNRLYDGLSADERRNYQRQYVDYALSVTKVLKKGAPDLTVVGGAFAYALAGDRLDSTKFAEGIAAAGLLRFVDAISFHTYVDPKTQYRDIGSFTAWLARSGAPDKPLWITEAGWPWKRGPMRPPLDQDQASAQQTAAKAIIAYALGVTRYYAFVYPYYEENDKNFGMSGKERTPLRSLAAYEQVAKTLSGARALIPAIVKGDGFAALFDSPKGAVMVVYKKQDPQKGSWLDVPFPVLDAQGIDGRHLEVRSGKVSFDDGLVYLWIPDAVLANAREMLGEEL